MNKDKLDKCNCFQCGEELIFMDNEDHVHCPECKEPYGRPLYFKPHPLTLPVWFFEDYLAPYLIEKEKGASEKELQKHITDRFGLIDED